MLLYHLETLFTQLGVDLPVADALVAEINPTDFTAEGKAIVDLRLLERAPTYATRFESLLQAGYDWINLSYYGLLEGVPLVAIELPHAVSGARKTSVNHAGPSNQVAQSGGDARAAIELRK
jgi:hypothetical protein